MQNKKLSELTVPELRSLNGRMMKVQKTEINGSVNYHLITVQSVKSWGNRYKGMIDLEIVEVQLEICNNGVVYQFYFNQGYVFPENNLTLEENGILVKTN